MFCLTSLFTVCQKVDETWSEYQPQYALSIKSLEDFALRSLTSVAIDHGMQDSSLVPSYLPDHIRSACRSVFSALAGWADFPHVSSDATAPDQSPKATLWGPVGEEGRDGGAERHHWMRRSRLHAGWQAMHQKMTAIPFFLK